MMILTLILSTITLTDNTNGRDYYTGIEDIYFYKGTNEECKKILDDIILSIGKTSVLFANIADEKDCFIDGVLEEDIVILNQIEYKLLILYKE